MSLITLTTDFGTRDGYVGAMKGRLLTMSPGTQIVDITHDIRPQNCEEAAWCLHRSVPHFPDGTIHIAVVDPGVGSSRVPLLVYTGNQWLIGPDNGIFSLILEKLESPVIYELKRHTQWWKAHASFDGLHLFAPAAACLANGVKPVEMATPVATAKGLNLPLPVHNRNQATGQILHFDQFGNAISNIHVRDIEELQHETFTIECNRQQFPLVTHYSAVREGERLAIVNSDGLLELSVCGGSARDSLHLDSGIKIVLS